MATMAEMAAQFHLQPGPHLTAGLYRNQGQEQSQRAMKNLEDAMAKRKSDEIANQLLQSQGAPPELQGKGTMGLQGWQQMQNWKQQQAEQNDQGDTAMNDLQYRMALANTTKAENQAYGDNSNEDGMTPYQREQLRLREMDINRKSQKGTGGGKADAWANTIAVGRGKVDETGEFKGDYNGDQVQLRTPTGKTVVVPWSAYQDHVQRAQPSAVQQFQDVQRQAAPPVPGDATIAPPAPDNNTATAPVSPNPQMMTTPNQPEQRVKVIGPDGKVGTIPATQLQQAIQSGYKSAQEDDGGDAGAA